MVGGPGPYKQRDDAQRKKARDNMKGRMAKMELLLRMWVWEGIHHNFAKRSAFVFTTVNAASEQQTCTCMICSRNPVLQKQGQPCSSAHIHGSRESLSSLKKMGRLALKGRIPRTMNQSQPHFKLCVPFAPTRTLKT